MLAEMKNTKATGGAAAGAKAIDWDRWAAVAESTAGNKGRNRTPEIRAKFSEAQKRRFAQDRQKLADALAAAKPAEAAPITRTVTVTNALFGSMQPGSWYATRDMATVAAVKYQAAKAFAVTWWMEGWLVRQQNPEWKPPARVGGKQEPKWLYRLSETGEQRHRVAAALL